MNTRIFITGGHLAPALAVIEEIQKEKKPWEIIFVGRLKAFEGDKNISYEYEAVTAGGLRFLPLYTGRLQRGINFRGILSILKIPLGFLQSLWYVGFYRPKLILVFGGYLALPVAVAGRLLGVPVIIHEQTQELGFANKIIGFFAEKILVSFPELSAKLPPGKSVYTGLPVRSRLFSPPKKPTFAYEPHIPLIYITGGTTGAVSLNDLIFPLIPQLARHFMIIQQTGSKSIAAAEKLADSLPQKLKQHYITAVNFDDNDVAWIYRNAALVIGRSGANTTAELAILGKTAILVPLPWSGGGEQRQNAARLSAAGSAVVVDQEKISPDKFAVVIANFFEYRHNYEVKAKIFAAGQIRDGAARVVSELGKVIS